MKIGSFDDEGCSISYVPFVVEWIRPVISISLFGGMLTLFTNVAAKYSGVVGFGQKGNSPIGNYNFSFS